MSDDPGHIDWRRPGWPFETELILGKHQRKQAESAGRFELSQVLKRSVEIVRRRWLVLIALAYGIGFTPYVVSSFVPRTSYDPGSNDFAGLSLIAARSLGLSLLDAFSTWAVVAAALGPGNIRWRLGPLAAPLAAFGALFPLWAAGEWSELGRLWVIWAAPWEHRAPGSSVGETFANYAMLFSFGPTVFATGLAAPLGLFVPVAIAEGRGFRGSIVRAWQLGRGNRWRVLAMFAAVVAIEFSDGFVTIGLRELRLTHPEWTDLRLTLSWMNSVAYHAVDAFWWILIAVAYLEMRRLREGASEDQIAEVFA